MAPKPSGKLPKKPVESESESEPTSESGDDSISEISHDEGGSSSAGTRSRRSSNYSDASEAASRSRSSRSGSGSDSTRSRSRSTSRSTRSKGDRDSVSRSTRTRSTDQGSSRGDKAKDAKKKGKGGGRGKGSGDTDTVTGTSVASSSRAGSSVSDSGSSRKAKGKGKVKGKDKGKKQRGTRSSDDSSDSSASEPTSTEDSDSDSESEPEDSSEEEEEEEEAPSPSSTSSVPQSPISAITMPALDGDGENLGAVSDSDIESEDDLPPPPPHVLAKILAAKSKARDIAAANLDLDLGSLSLGLAPVQPDGLSGLPTHTTALKTRTTVGQTALELLSVQGVSPGARLIIGSGAKVDRCRVIMGGHMSNRIVIDQPIKFLHKPGTACLVFGLKRAKAEVAPEPVAAAAEEEEEEEEEELHAPLSPGANDDNKSVLSKVSVDSKLTHSSQSQIHSNYSSPSSKGIRPLVDLEPQSPPPKTTAEIILEALDDGYSRVQARFMGYQDPLEDVYYMFSADQRWMKILVDSGEGVIDFDVGGGHCTVGEDGSDVTAAFMEYHGHTIHFKMPTEKKIQNFIDEFPDNCFAYPEAEEEEAVDGEQEVDGGPPKPRVINAKYEEKKKDTSHHVNAQAEARKARVKKTLEKLKAKQQGKTLETLLDSLEPGNSRLSLSQIAQTPLRDSLSTPRTPRQASLSLSGQGATARMSVTKNLSRTKSMVPFADDAGRTGLEDDDEDLPLPPPPNVPPRSNEDSADWMVPPPHSPHTPMPPSRQKELVNTRIKKNVPSVRRVALLCRWLNFLQFWPEDISVTSMHTEFCTGLLLMDLMKVLVPGCESQYLRVNRKTLSRKPAESNLEQALGVIFRSKTVNHARIPSASDIFDGNINKIAIMIDELFLTYIQAPLYKSAIKMFRWYHKILKQYQRPIPDDVFDSGDVGYVWPAFQSGVSLFCIIYHFFGNTMIGGGSTTVKIDPIRIVYNARSYDDMKANVTYCFQLLKALDIQLLWKPEEWITLPDTEFCTLQLSYIYEFLCTRQCSLAPATNEAPGLATGRGGEALVVGLAFADTACAGIDRHRVTKHVTTLLGAAENTLPMLSVDIVKRQGAPSAATIAERNNPFGPERVKDDLMDTVPLGLLTGHVRIEKKKVKLSVPVTTRTLMKPLWDSKTAVAAVPVAENFRDAPIINVLHSINQKTPSSKTGEGDISMSIDGTPKYALSNKKPLSKIRKELLLGAQQEELNSRSSIVSLDLESLKQGIVSLSSGNAAGADEPEATQAQRHLTVAMQKLEEEMSSSTKELATLEEELEARYLLLEEEAAAYDEAEYEETLAFLDDETTKLEADRLRIQQLFALKLASMKDQFDEAVIRTRGRDAEKRAAEAEARRKKGLNKDGSRRTSRFYDNDEVSMMSGSSHGAGVTFGANQTKEFSQYDMLNNSARSAGSTSTPSKSCKKTLEEKKQLEKGWTMHNRKVTSHNVQIQKTIDSSRLKLYQSWLSPRSRQKEEREAESEAKRIAAKLGLGSANVDKASLRHLLKEAEYVDASFDASDNATVRSQGSAKKGQGYAHIMNESTQSRMLKSKSLESRLAEGTNDPKHVFEAFKIKLYTRSQIWYEKRGLSRDVPTQPITEPPVPPVIPFLQQLLQTPSPFSIAHTKPHDPDTDSDAADNGISVEQVGLWKRIRKEALEKIEWEEYRQKLAAGYTPVARKNGMGGLFASNPDDESETKETEENKTKAQVPEEEETNFFEEGDAESKMNAGDAPAPTRRRTSMRLQLEAPGDAEGASGAGNSSRDSASSLAAAYDAQGNSLKAPAAAPAEDTIPSVISSSDADAAIRYLQTARTYVLADRTNTEYIWQLNMVSNKATHSSRIDVMTSQMILLWSLMTSPNAPLGSINLSDIKTLTYDAIPESTRQASSKATINVIGANTGLVITLQLKNSPKALKNSGGRTKLVLKGLQVQETKKMHFCLRALWLVASQQSKLVSVESMSDAA